MPKPKLDPEERKRIRAQKKLEKREAARRRARQIKVDALTREIRYSNLTIKRHERQWRKLLTKITLPTLRDDLKYAWHLLELTVDAKDFAISLLMDEIRQDNDKSLLAFKAHAENIDRLMTFFRDRLDELRAEFDDAVKEMRKDIGQKMDEWLRESCGDTKAIRLVVTLGNERNKRESSEARGLFLSAIDMMRSLSKTAIIDMFVGKASRIKNLFEEARSIMDKYEEYTRKTQKESEELYSQDAAVQELMKQQMEKIEGMCQVTEKLNEKYRILMQSKALLIESRMREYTYLSTTLIALQKKIERQSKKDDNNIGYVIYHSQIIINELTKIRDLGRKVITLAALCSKMETAKERVLRFPTCQLPKIIKSSTNIQVVEDTNELTYFWLRVGQADAMRYALAEEREHLRRENELLKRKIHKYCECLTCEALPQIQPRRGRLNVVDLNMLITDRCKVIEQLGKVR